MDELSHQIAPSIWVAPGSCLRQAFLPQQHLDGGSPLAATPTGQGDSRTSLTSSFFKALREIRFQGSSAILCAGRTPLRPLIQEEGAAGDALVHSV